MIQAEGHTLQLIIKLCFPLVPRLVVVTAMSLHISSFVFWGRLAWLRTVYYFRCRDFVVSDLKAVWSGPPAASRRQWDVDVTRAALVESCQSYGCEADDRIGLEQFTRHIMYFLIERRVLRTVLTINPLTHMSVFCLHFFPILLLLFDFVSLSLTFWTVILPLSPCLFSRALTEEPLPDLWWILWESREGPEAAAGAQ